MPLARILTFLPEDAAVLSRQLEHLGFEVEVANPNEEQLTPAELEIEFAICDQQQVLARAAAIATQLQAEIVVFPRAVPALPRPASVAVETAPPEAPEIPVTSQLSSTQVDQSEAEYQSSGIQPEGVEEKTSGLAERAKPIWEAIAARITIGSRRIRAMTGAALSRLKETGIAVAKRSREFQERTRQRAAEARAARERQRVESNQASTPVQQPPGEVEHSGVAYQEELQRAQVERQRRLAEMDRLREEAREQVLALQRARLAAEAQYEQSQQQQPEEPISEQRMKSLRPQRAQLRGVLTGAVAASVLFIAGILLANFHPSRPLPTHMSGSSVEQDVPFGSTTLHGPPGVTVGGVKTSKAVVSIPKVASPALQAKPQPAIKAAPVRNPKSQWRKFGRKSNRSQDGTTPEDVVVRHFGPSQKPVPSQKPIARNTQQQPGVKHYSDQ